VRVAIEPHPNADAIELAKVGGYVSIVKKGQFKTGDLAVYLPEQSVLPEWMLKQLGFWDDINNKGTLSGSAGNRIRAIKLRGVLSQGVLLGGNCGDYPDAGLRAEYGESPQYIIVRGNPSDGVTPSASFEEGENAAEFLGVTKYEPAIPVHMAGRVAGGDLDATIAYDFENLKKIPDLFDDGEEVVFTEKIHGTLLQVGVIPPHLWEGKSWADKCPDIGDDGYKGVVTSKGQGARGLLLDPSDLSNLYVAMVRELGLWEKLEYICTQNLGCGTQPAFLFGEIYGQGVQDLGYGTPIKRFRAFDLYVGGRDKGHFVSHDTFERVLMPRGIPTVPVLYRGPFGMDQVAKHTDGNTTLTEQKHIREGIVIKATNGAAHPRHGRKIAKSVSAQYLLRKGEVSEYQ
jgi:RNA ligase (TIGR02306 family)